MGSRQPILLVDDDPDDVDLCSRSLRKAGILNEILVARDGQEALDYFARGGAWEGRPPGERPVVVLLDLKMPRVDGLEVLRRIRSDPATRSQPVVILTSSREDRDVASGYELGANAYVEKPVEFSAFSGAMASLGVFWLLVNVPPPRVEA